MSERSSSMTGKRRAKVLIVDDHPLVRRGVTQVVNQEPDLSACGEAEDVPAALEAVERLRPDVVIVDIALKGRSGLELIKLIKAREPRLPILALSMHDEALYAQRALKAGARGYVMKDQVAEALLVALRRVLGGGMYLSESMTARMLEGLAAPSDGEERLLSDRLSDRELEVFELIGQGRSTREIADTLHLSVKTIETYRAHLIDKLQVANASELVQRAVRWVQRHEPR